MNVLAKGVWSAVEYVKVTSDFIIRKCLIISEEITSSV